MDEPGFAAKAAARRSGTPALTPPTITKRAMEVARKALESLNSIVERSKASIKVLLV